MELVKCVTGQLIDSTAVEAFNDWYAYISLTDGKAPVVTEIYRTPEEQDRLYRGWVNRLPGFNPAYSSKDKRANHIKGLSVDWGYQGRPTARRTAAMFNFKFNIANEEWHCEYQGGYVRPHIDKIGDKMYILTAKGRGQIFSDYGTLVRLGTDSEVKMLLKQELPILELDPATYDRMNARAWG